MSTVYIGTGNPSGLIDVDESNALAGSRLQLGLIGAPGLAHHIVSRRDICFDSANGLFFFRRNTTPGNPNTFVDLVSINANGDMRVRGTLNAAAKNFSIPHPCDPDHLQLMHGSIEGPEYAVFYRGQGQLHEGAATVTLPDYFEPLTMEQGRSVQLTPLCDGDGPLSSLAASTVRDGSFTVRAIDASNPSQAFYWEVKAVRSDVAPLEVEVSHSGRDAMAEATLV